MFDLDKNKAYAIRQTHTYLTTKIVLVMVIIRLTKKFVNVWASIIKMLKEGKNGCFAKARTFM